MRPISSVERKCSTQLPGESRGDQAGKKTVHAEALLTSCVCCGEGHALAHLRVCRGWHGGIACTGKGEMEPISAQAWWRLIVTYICYFNVPYLLCA